MKENKKKNKNKKKFSWKSLFPHNKLFLSLCLLLLVSIFPVTNQESPTKGFTLPSLLPWISVQEEKLEGKGLPTQQQKSVNYDAYEPDNSYQQAAGIRVNQSGLSPHFINYEKDEDWVSFFIENPQEKQTIQIYSTTNPFTPQATLYRPLFDTVEKSLISN